MPEEVTVRKVARKIPIWKISHGALTSKERKACIERHIALLSCEPTAKQRLAFKTEVKKGDLFYLCYKSKSVVLLGRFTSDAKLHTGEPKLEKKNRKTKKTESKGEYWYKREYEVIAESKNKSPYKSKTGFYWEPNGYSACFRIREKDEKQFEERILKPYFGKTLAITSTDYHDGAEDGKNVPDDEDHTQDKKTPKATTNMPWRDPFQDPNPNPFQGTFVKPYRAYTWENFLGDVYLGKNLDEGKEKYGRLVRLLENRKNIILQGPPGVGKTYAAKRLAWSILKSDIDELKNTGGKDPRIQFVQFHQSYSYEDFVEGYKPNDGKEKKDGEFVLQPGVFRRFCEAIKEDNEKAVENGEEKKKFFFIIDEINRGNTSKIFGELLMLIENDHRGEETKLAYSRIDFSVPKNLYIIGMMNTADRNLAMIDYALRRRFAFVDVEPAFESDDENYGFKKYQKKLLERCNETEKTIFKNLIEEVRLLNDAISNDQSLRKGFCIGHSYFCGWENAEDITKKMQDVVDCDIVPTLREYWFDAEEEVAGWERGFRSVLNGKEAKGKEELPKS